MCLCFVCLIEMVEKSKAWKLCRMTFLEASAMSSALYPPAGVPRLTIQIDNCHDESDSCNVAFLTTEFTRRCDMVLTKASLQFAGVRFDLSRHTETYGCFMSLTMIETFNSKTTTNQA